MENTVQKKRTKDNPEKKNSTSEVMRRRKVTEEERIRIKEEKKLKKLVSFSCHLTLLCI